MEVVRNRETHAGRSAAVEMIMASQITGPHLSSSNSLSNHTALRLQQPTRLLAFLSNRLGGTAPPPTAQEKPRPRLLNSIQYTNFVSMDCTRAMEQSVKKMEERQWSCNREEGEARRWFWNGDDGEERRWFCNGEEGEERAAAI